jgi:hypothetical protein
MEDTLGTPRRFVTVVSVLLVLAACGGSNPAGPNPTPTPTGASCTQTVVFQDSGPIPPNNVVIKTFTTTAAGRIDAVVDWTFADSNIGLAVYRGNCGAQQYSAGTCDLLIGKASPPKPLKGSSASSSVPAGTYGLVVANVTLVNESYSSSVTLSSAGCPAVSSRVSRP